MDAPRMKTLLSILAKPSCLKIAINMVKSWMDHDTSHSKDSCDMTEPVKCTSCFLTDHMRSTPTVICHRFHFTCLLKYLSINELKIDEDNCNLESWPLFLSYPTIVQQNILILIDEFLPLIPNIYIKNFISLIEGNITPSSWLGYILRKLKCRILSSNATGIVGDFNGVPFNNDSLDKIREAFCLSNQIVVESVSLFDSTSNNASSNNDDMRTKSHKRSLTTTNKIDEENEHVESKRAKISKIDLTSDAIEESQSEIISQKLLHETALMAAPLGDESTAEIKTTEDDINAFAVNQSVIEEHIQPNNQDCDVKALSLIVSKWETGLPCDQTDYDEIVSSAPKFSKFVLEAAAKTYTDNGIIAVATNILNSNVDMSYLQLTSCFKELLTNKIVCLQKAISRGLALIVTSLFEKFTFTFVDGFLSTLICHESFASNHCTFVRKLINVSLSEDHRTRLWLNIMTEGGKDNVWNDHLLLCLTCLIDKGIRCDSGHQSCVQLLEKHSSYHSNSLVFTKFLLSLMSKHGTKFADFKDVIQKIANENKTVLRSKLAKLLE